MEFFEKREGANRPFFSVCIPQYNRFPHLLEALHALSNQTYKDFEICISDDRSPDAGHQEAIRFLDKKRIPYVYLRQERNLKYDANLRESIRLANGQYCFLHGNDDRLASDDILQKLHGVISTLGERPGVVLTNYHQIGDGQKFERVRSDGVLGAGPAAAAANFRNFSFISGVVLDRDICEEFKTTKWDGSEMYQMYLGTRAIASGRTLVGVRQICTEKDIEIPGEIVDNYKRAAQAKTHTPRETLLPMRRIGSLVLAALSPYISAETKNRLALRIYRQLYGYTYPFWLVEYRRIKSWKYSISVARGMHPQYTIEDSTLERSTKAIIFSLYYLATLAGMSVPVIGFDKAYPMLYKIAKREMS